MANKTALQIMQKKIDKCNKGDGCNRYCSKKNQQSCEKLKAHSDRMEYCQKMGIDIMYW